VIIRPDRDGNFLAPLPNIPIFTETSDRDFVDGTLSPPARGVLHNLDEEGS